MAKLNIGTFDGKEHIGSIMFYPDSAADCTIMGQQMLKTLGVHPKTLDPPDSEGVDAANKIAFTMMGSMKVTMEYMGKLSRI